MQAPTLNNSGEHANYAAGARSRSLTATSHATTNLNAQTESELTLVTAEGDRVTLSARAQMAYRYAEFSVARITGNSMLSASGMAQEFMTSSSFDMQVEGELNEQELSDIRELVMSFKSSIKQFFSGDLQGVIEQAQGTPQQLADLDTIAQFDYSFDLNAEFATSSSQTLAIEQGPRAEGIPRGGRADRAGQSFGKPDSSAGSSTSRRVSPAALESAPSDHRQDLPEPIRIAIGAIDALTNELVQHVEARGLQTERYQALLPELVDQAVSELQAEPENAGSRSRISMLDELRNELVDRFEARNDAHNYRVDTPGRPAANESLYLSELA